MTISAQGRRLEGIERLAAIGNEFYQGCFNLATVLEIEGPLTAELIQRAIEYLQQKYECLKVVVTQDPNQNQEWVFKYTNEIAKLHIVNSTHAEHYLEIWQEIISSKIDGLAWRVVWVQKQGSNQSHLLGLFHHAIFDGASMAFFFDSLLQLAHDFAKGICIDTPMIQPISPTVHRFTRANWPLIALARIGYYRYRRSLRTIKFDPQGDILENRRWHTIFKRLEHDTLEDLLIRCHNHSVTLGNAFSAAILLEVADHIRHYESKPFNLALCTTVDLRRLNKQIPPTPLMGALLSGILSFFRPSSSDTLWKVAHNVGKKIKRSMWLNEDRNLTLLQSLIGNPKFAAWQIHNNHGRPPEGIIAVTNMGRMIKFEHGPFRATAIHATAAQAIWGCTFLLGFITVQDRLCITLGYPFPSIGDATAESILDGVIHRLFV